MRGRYPGIKDCHSQKQAGKVWYDHLKDKLTKLGFIQSRFDECVFYYGKTIFLVYTDDTILVGPDEGEIENIVRTLSKDFKVEDQGDLRSEHRKEKRWED
jgi:hypothetical protein